MLEKEEKAKGKLEAQATQGVPSPDFDTDKDQLLPHTATHIFSWRGAEMGVNGK